MRINVKQGNLDMVRDACTLYCSDILRRMDYHVRIAGRFISLYSYLNLGYRYHVRVVRYLARKNAHDVQNVGPICFPPCNA